MDADRRLRWQGCLTASLILFAGLVTATGIVLSLTRQEPLPAEVGGGVGTVLAVCAGWLAQRQFQQYARPKAEEQAREASEERSTEDCASNE